MPLNPTGPISLGGNTLGESVALQLGLSPTGPISLNDAAVRALAEVPTGTIVMPDNFWGKPAGFTFTPTITSNTNNYNLISAATAAGWNGVSALTANITVNAGVTIGSTSASTAAFLIGSLPAGSIVTLTNNGTIVGKGGNGGSAGPSPGTIGSAGGGGGGTLIGLAGIPGTLVGNAGNNGTSTTGGTGGARLVASQPGSGPNQNIIGTNGENGGIGLLTNYATSVINNGTIAGGGGGGGGGGATIRFIMPGGAPTLVATSGFGGNGGNLGQPGTAGETIVAGADGGLGGAAGNAINGTQPVTLSGSGTLIGPSTGVVFTATIASSTNNYNVKTAAIAAGWDQVSPLSAIVTIDSGVFIRSTSTATPAFDTGATFPVGTTISVINNGFIVGRGGDGGTSAGSGGGGGAGNGLGGGAGLSGIGNPGSNGTDTTGGAGGATNSVGNPMGTGGAAPGNSGFAGGPALRAQTPITLTNNGTIGGGGGGGGAGGYIRQPSVTMTAFGGGAGGNLGNAGSTGIGGGVAPGGVGGAAGAAIVGNSNITYAATGTILGSIT